MTKQTLIPAQYAEIFWNDDKKGDRRAGGAEVVVTDIRVRQEQEIAPAKTRQDTISARPAPIQTAG